MPNMCAHWNFIERAYTKKYENSLKFPKTLYVNYISVKFNLKCCQQFPGFMVLAGSVGKAYGSWPWLAHFGHRVCFKKNKRLNRN